MVDELKLPKGWRLVTLSEVSDIKPSNVDKKIHANEIKVFLCNYMDVYSNNYLNKQLNYSEGSVTNTELLKFRLKKDDVIITKDSETPDDIAIPSVVTEELKNVVCGYHLALIRPNSEKIKGVYLSKALLTKICRSHFGNSANGATRYGLTQRVIFSCPILLPPIDEQVEISKVLITIDQAIEKTEQLIAKYERIKTGLMQDLLTRGIDEQGNIRSEKTHEFKDSVLGRIPREWDVVTLKETCERIQDGTHFSPKTSKIGEFMYITSKNIRFGELELNNVEYVTKEAHEEIYRRCPVQYGDVLLTKDGANTGNITLNTIKEPISLLSSVAYLRGKKGFVRNDFLFQSLSSENSQKIFRDQMSGNAITRITLQKINATKIAVPKPEEQKRIVLTLEAYDKLWMQEKENLSKNKLMKTALMQDLLTGKVRVDSLISNTVSQ